jgi:hypothetical protein
VQRLGYGGLLLVILDGFTGYTTEEIEEVFLHYSVFVILLAPHNSNPIQPLDLFIFAVQKMEVHRIHTHVDLNPVNIIAAFRNGRICGMGRRNASAYRRHLLNGNDKALKS